MVPLSIVKIQNVILLICLIINLKEYLRNYHVLKKNNDWPSVIIWPKYSIPIYINPNYQYLKIHDGQITYGQIKG